MASDLLSAWSFRVKQRAMWSDFSQPLIERLTKVNNAENALRAFFNEKDYTINTYNDKDNYLIYLLTGNNAQNDHLLFEMADLIKYQQITNASLALNSATGKKVNHESLSSLLFEAYVNKILSEAGLIVENNKEYVDTNGNIKPLDGFFEFQDNKYIIECYRPNEPVNKSLLRLNEYLMRIMAKPSIHNYQAFRGHIGFKTNSGLDESVNQVIKSIGELYRKYLDAFNTDGLVVTIPKRYNYDNYDIEIMPYYMGTDHKSELEHPDNNYNPLISFQTEPHENNIERCRFVISGTRMTYEDILNKKLAEKIQSKRKQHKDAPYCIIYFIELDETVGVNPNNPVFPYLTQKQLQTNYYQSKVEKEPNSLFVFVFKKATKNGIERAFRCLYNPKHDALIERIKAEHTKEFK